MAEIVESEKRRSKEEMIRAAFIGYQNYLVNWENPKSRPMSFQRWLETFGLAERPTLAVRREEIDQDIRRAFALLDRVRNAPGFSEVVQPPVGTVIEIPT